MYNNVNKKVYTNNLSLMFNNKLFSLVGYFAISQFGDITMKWKMHHFTRHLYTVVKL